MTPEFGPPPGGWEFDEALSGSFADVRGARTAAVIAESERITNTEDAARIAEEAANPKPQSDP